VGCHDVSLLLGRFAVTPGSVVVGNTGLIAQQRLYVQHAECVPEFVAQDGCQESSTTISRIERLNRAPSLAAQALALVFGTRALELFPRLFTEIHDALRARVNELYEELQGNPSKTTRVKQDFLEEVLARLDEQGDMSDV
jgi:hypothetical protein